MKNDQAIIILQSLFQLCLDTQVIPSEWSKAIVKPLPKSPDNDPRIPLNYRGISLLSCAGKIFTSLLNTRLMTYLDYHAVLVDEQNGFRRGRSCIDHIYSLHCITQDRLNKGLKTYLTFIDFAKAFDTLDRKMLLHKILHTGIDGKFYFTLKALYESTKSCVEVNGNRGTPGSFSITFFVLNFH